MAFLQPENPRLFNAIPLRENPSYGSELPQDFPYDPGATRSLFELGYIPKGESWIYLIILLICVTVAAAASLRTRSTLPNLFRTLMIISLIFVFLGPFSLPTGLPVRTTIGLAKASGVLLALIALVRGFFVSKHNILSTKSMIPIGLYIFSILLSIISVTNLNFFMEDLSIIISGILFFYISYSFIDDDRISHDVITALGFCSLIASALVLFIAFFPQKGTDIISAIYPQYENIVFQFDLSRGRILSIIDIEFFLPCILYIFVVFKQQMAYTLGVFVAASAAVFLTNYRYRFLTYLAGFISFFSFAHFALKKRALIVIGGVLTLTFAVYISIAVAFGQVNLIDRFLLKDYANDVDSLRRRVLMIGQAVDLFTSKPILGVGLGNYKDNVQITYESFGGRFYEPFYKILQNVYAYPHNWFVQVLAENGIIGFTALLYMLYTFATIDRKLYRSLKGKRHLLMLTFSITSWLYVFANQFTPLSNSQPMVIFFWAFRGIIERMNNADTV